MELEYATRDLEKTCTDERVMQKKLGAQIAKTLKLRIAEMRRAVGMGDFSSAPDAGKNCRATAPDSGRRD